VGTVFLGLATEAGTEVRQFAFQGDRIQIRSQATNAALNWLIETAEAIAN
jgi:nicotinamide mononucleotide (NMN) deamidase PncC